MKKFAAICLAMLVLISGMTAYAEGTPPEPPAGMEEGATPPELPEGAERGMPEGGNPPAMPGGGPGGAQSAPETYEAVNTMEEVPRSPARSAPRLRMKTPCW